MTALSALCLPAPPSSSPSPTHPPTLIPSVSRPQSLQFNRYPTLPTLCRSSSIRRRLSSVPSPSLPVEDLVEKDWSFLDTDAINSTAERARKARRIITAAEISPESRVLAAMPTLGFVDTLVASSPCELLCAVHESLLVLAMIKEGHDGVRCWQGDVSAVPARLGLFDAVFVCYFPAMGVSAGQLLSSLAPRCSRGARIVVCFDQGRQTVEQHHSQQFPDIVTSALPDKATLAAAAADNGYQVAEFVDEPTFYLAVLRFQE